MNYVEQWGKHKYDFAGYVLTPGILAKLKTRQFPSSIHRNVVSERNTISEMLLAEQGVYHRSMKNDVISFNEIRNSIRNNTTAPMFLNKEHTSGILDRNVQTYVDRSKGNKYHPLSATREFKIDPWFIPKQFPEAGRIISNHPVQINQEFPKSNRIIHHNPAYIEDVTTQLKAHRLIVVLGALEDTDKQMVASRESTELGYLFRAKPEAHHEDVQFAYVERKNPRVHESIKKLHICLGSTRKEEELIDLKLWWKKSITRGTLGHDHCIFPE